MGVQTCSWFATVAALVGGSTLLRGGPVTLSVGCRFDQRSIRHSRRVRYAYMRLHEERIAVDVGRVLEVVLAGRVLPVIPGFIDVELAIAIDGHLDVALTIGLSHDLNIDRFLVGVYNLPGSFISATL